MWYICDYISLKRYDDLVIFSVVKALPANIYIIFLNCSRTEAVDLFFCSIRKQISALIHFISCSKKWFWMTVPQQRLSRTLISYHGKGQWVSNYQKRVVICAPVQNNFGFLLFKTPYPSYHIFTDLKIDKYIFLSAVFNLTCTHLHFLNPPLFICICLCFTVMQIHQLNFVTSYGRRRGKPAWRWSLPGPDPPNRWSTLRCLYWARPL